MNLTDLQVSEFRKMKIGALVRSTLPEILQEELITELEINKLEKDEKWRFYIKLAIGTAKKVF